MRPKRLDGIWLRQHRVVHGGALRRSARPPQQHHAKSEPPATQATRQSTRASRRSPSRGPARSRPPSRASSTCRLTARPTSEPEVGRLRGQRTTHAIHRESRPRQKHQPTTARQSTRHSACSASRRPKSAKAQHLAGFLRPDLQRRLCGGQACPIHPDACKNAECAKQSVGFVGNGALRLRRLRL